ncbi:MAG: rod shape-determining protein MreD [Rhodospirillaceae bacterium]|nr:rod shape-determining protein MreD [Rhodospirillaceae bacterium]
MQATILQRMDGAARRLVPFGVTLVLMLFAMTPTYVPGLSHITPLYALMAVYFWSIYRPDLLGYGSTFAIGVLEDLLAGTPLGSGALILLLCQWIVLHQQKFFNNKPFGVMWLAFALVAAGASLLRWLCVGLVETSGFTPVTEMAASYLMTVAIYPIVGWFLAKAHMKLLAQ